MNRTEMLAAIEQAGYPALVTAPTSERRFADGSRYRIEIPSCEGPAVMAAVIETATAMEVPIHRVSQGSGVMMLSDSEIRDMVALGVENGIEVNLFIGPRGSWDIGGQAKVTTAVGGAARGNKTLAATVVEAHRAVALGVRSLLVGDLGALAVLGAEKTAGRLPADLVLKTSVLMPLTNAATAHVYADLGATSLNLSTDLAVAHLAEIRQAVDVPVDMYVEVPDDQGGAVRFYDVPELIRVAAPVYVKLGVRNAPNIYPSGRHLEPTAIGLGAERVRRAALVLRMLAELDPDIAKTVGGHDAADLALPKL
jgi:hypothetical protein